MLMEELEALVVEVIMLQKLLVAVEDILELVSAVEVPVVLEVLVVLVLADILVVQEIVTM